MEVLKECRENNPEELYGVAASIRPEVMNGEMATSCCRWTAGASASCPYTCKRRNGCWWRLKRRGCPPSGVAAVRKSLLTPEVYVRCAAHSRESLMMILWRNARPEVCLMAKTLYPDWVRNHPEFVPESVHNQDSVYTLNSLMESLTGKSSATGK